MAALVETVMAALAGGTNPVTAVRQVTGYGLEELAVSSGLSIAEIAAIEAGELSADSLRRIANALGWPDDALAA